MKLILDIQENSRTLSFIKLINSLDYIRIVKKVKSIKNSDFIDDLAEAFNEVKLHEQGKITLKSAKDLLNEL